MSEKQSIPPVERAIALAAWVSIHMLKPVPIEEDEIADVLGWKTHLDDHEELFDVFLPSYPEQSYAAETDAERLADAILPVPGRAWPLQLYHFFESTIDPRRTDCDALLRAIASALRSRLLPSAARHPSALAGFIVGELGVIQGTEVSLTFPPAEGSLAQYIETLRDHLQPCEIDGYDALLPHGWSALWTGWASFTGPLRHTDASVVNFHFSLRGWQATDWTPIAAMKYWFEWDRVLPQWLAGPLAAIHRLEAAPLSAILNRCIQHDRRVFHEQIDWSLAPEARGLLDTLPAELEARHARQLLLVAPPETVVAAAIELGHHRATLDEYENSFSEQLTDALLVASTRADAGHLLNALVSRAGGTHRDQVLHYVMRQGPAAVLQGPLMTPFVATEIARITGAPLRFHRVETWDPSEPADTAALADHLQSMLGEQRPPALSQRARRLTTAPPTEDSEALRNRLNQGRRRAEWVFKTAIEHLYRLLRSTHAPLEFLMDCGDPNRCFWRASKFMARVVSKNESLKPLLPLDPQRRLTLRDLLSISAATESLVPSDAPPFMQAAAAGQQRLRSLCEERKVPQLGNEGSHDNPMDRGTLVQAVESVHAFDSAVLDVPDALPRFFVFTRLVREPNKPSVVEFAAHPELHSSSSARVEHFVSDRSFPLDTLRGDRIYAVTDVTRNTISINPIIHDWTEWLTE